MRGQASQLPRLRLWPDHWPKLLLTGGPELRATIAPQLPPGARAATAAVGRGTTQTLFMHSPG
jgi:hypothetical protein